ncbi:MAG: hypothetical protein K0Q76_926 [Panacagrimonas sp.]|jgi:hypothetical protein|nr:DUF2066 domain-containing protein [Panacagrimonas sp.]MCC2655818.1 hypothetical protein [Panacagrimonas sp.]
MPFRSLIRRPRPRPRLAALAVVLGLIFPVVSDAQPRGATAPTAPDAAVQGRPLPGNPYGALVPVEDESSASRDKGLRMALILVLKGAVGRYDPATGPILALAPRLVQQYSFQRDEPSGELMFKAVFDSRAVNEALRGQGLPVFGLDSSVIETWVIQVAGLRTTADYSRVLRHFTRVRGVRSVDVDDVRDERLQLRLVVEGGVQAAAIEAEKSGLVARDPTTGHYVLAQR